MSGISTEGTPVALQSDSDNNPATFPISTSGHLLLVYKDDSGAEYVIRGGPQPGVEGYGNLTVEINEPIDSSVDARVVQQDDGTLTEVTAEFRGSTEIDFGDRDIDKVWDILIEHAENINSASFAYDPFGHNSNGTVANLLSVVGIDIDDFMPDPVGIMLVPFSGHEKEFSFDYTLNGTTDDDVLIGSGGKQQLSGGVGNDQISGGDDTDTLTGGAGQDIFFGTPDDLNGDTITDLEVGDFIQLEGVTTSDIIDNFTYYGIGSNITLSFDEGALDFFGTTVNINMDIPDGATLKLVEDSAEAKIEVVGRGQDIAFVVDTTGSMSDDIANVKASATEIINSVFDPERGLTDSRIAVVGFNDPTTETVLSFTDHADPEDRKDAALNAINSLSANGGGDFPELTYTGLLRA